MAYGYDADACLLRTDLGTKAEAKRRLFEQSFGWHFVRIDVPMTTVGAMLQDWMGKRQASFLAMAARRPTPGFSQLLHYLVHQPGAWPITVAWTAHEATAGGS